MPLSHQLCVCVIAGRFNISVTVKNEGLGYGASKPNIEKACEGLEVHQKNDEEYIRVPIHLPSPLFLVVLLRFSTMIGQMIKICVIIIFIMILLYKI